MLCVEPCPPGRGGGGGGGGIGVCSPQEIPEFTCSDVATGYPKRLERIQVPPPLMKL